MTDTHDADKRRELRSAHIRLPKIIANGDASAAATVLRTYYGARYPRAGETTEAYMGAWFDEFDPSGTRAEHPNEFTADDLVAVALLNTPINLTAGKMIRFDLRDEINALLSQIPTNVALWEVDQPIDRAWPAWQLETLLLTKVKHIGLTRASKLIARKRPLLYPINDKEVRSALQTHKSHIGPLHDALQDEKLRDFLVAAREVAGLPPAVTELRVLDVLVWMRGT